MTPAAASRPEPTTSAPALGVPERDETDSARAGIYDLLAQLLARAPTAAILDSLSRLTGDPTPLGEALAALGDAARRADPERVSREYFDLFVGLARGELVPYASFYLTGFLHERPLARLRADLERLGIERSEDHREPEDHIAVLCDLMGGCAGGRLEIDAASERLVFERHLKPWAARLFADLEVAQAAVFYRAVGRLGRVFMEIEAEAFALDA